MRQQTRMFKTLGCLVVAMTGVSFLLTWLDPTDYGLEVPTAEQMLCSARSMVCERTLVKPELWREVEVVAATSAATSGQLLSAGMDQPRCHFRIQPDGEVFRTQRWQSQRATEDRRGAVLIEVCQRRSGEPMTAAQSDMLRALVASLTDVIAGPSRPLPIRLSSTWAQVYNVDESAVFEIVPSDSSTG